METFLCEEEKTGIEGNGRYDWKLKVRTLFFDLLYECFYKQKHTKRSHSIEMLLVVSGSFLCFAHICSVMQWSDPRLQSLTAVFSLTRVDVLAAYVHLTTELMYVQLVALFTPLIGLILTKIKTIPEGISKAILNLSIIYIVKIAFVPLIVVHGFTLKCLFSTCTSSKMEAIYYGDFDSVDLFWAQIISLPSLLMTLTYAYCYHFLLYPLTTFHPKTSHFLSLSLSLPTRIHLLTYSLTVFLQILSDHPLFTSSASLLLLVLALYVQVLYLPFVHMWVNAVHVGCAAGMCWVFAVQVMEVMFGEEVSAFYLVVTVTWSVGVIGYWRTYSRFRGFKDHSNRCCANLYDLDFLSRYAIRSHCHSDTIKFMYRSAYNTLHSDFVILWEASILLTHYNNPSGASLLLSLLPPKSPTLEISFQRHILLKSAESHSNKSREHLEFLLVIEELKRSDELLCKLLTQFCTTLLNPIESIRKLEDLVLKTITEKHNLSKTYTLLMNTYKSDRQIKALYGTFLVEILGDASGHMLLLQSDSANHHEPGVIFLYAQLNRIGEIAIINDTLRNILNFDIHDIRGQSSASFLPRYLQPLAIPVLKAAIYENNTTEVESLFSFLIDNNGFLGNFKVNCKLIAWKQIPLFFLTFRKGKEKDDFLVMSGNGEIVGNTVNFRQNLMQNAHIEDLFADFNVGETGKIVVFDKIMQENVVLLVDEMEICGKKLYKATKLQTVGISEITLSIPKGVRFISESTDVSQSFQPLKPSKPTFSAPDTTKGLISTSSTFTSPDSLTKVYEQKIRFTIRRSHVVVLMVYLIVIAMILASLLTVESIVQHLLNQDSIRAIGRQRYLNVEIAYIVRMINLIQTDRITGESEEFFRKELKSDLNYLYAAMNETNEKLPIWPDGPYKEMHFAPVIPQWIYYESHPEMSLQGILPVMTTMLRATAAVSGYHSINFSTPYVQYIYRNGPAENSVYQNKSVFLFLEQEKINRLNDFAVADSLVVAAIIVLITAILTLAVPQIVLLERLNRDIWRQLFTLPSDQVLELRRKVVDRLGFIHGVDDPAESYSRPTKPSHSSPIWPYFLLELLVFFLFSGLFFGLMFTGPYHTIKDKLTSLPSYLNWSQLYHLYFEGSCFWNNELYFMQNFNQSYMNLLGFSQYWTNPVLNLEQYQCDFTFTNHLLRELHPEYGIFTTNIGQNYTNFRLNTACDQVTIPNCNKTALYLGEYYSATEFMQSIRDKTASIQSKTALKEDIFACEKERKVVSAGHRFVNSIIEGEMKSSIYGDYEEMQGGVVGYCVCVVVLYLAGNCAIVRRCEYRMKQATEMMRITKRK